MIVAPTCQADVRYIGRAGRRSFPPFDGDACMTVARTATALTTRDGGRAVCGRRSVAGSILTEIIFGGCVHDAGQTVQSSARAMLALRASTPCTNSRRCAGHSRTHVRARASRRARHGATGSCRMPPRLSRWKRRLRVTASPVTSATDFRRHRRRRSPSLRVGAAPGCVGIDDSCAAVVWPNLFHLPPRRRFDFALAWRPAHR